MASAVPDLQLLPGRRALLLLIGRYSFHIQFRVGAEVTHLSTNWAQHWGLKFALSHYFGYWLLQKLVPP